MGCCSGNKVGDAKASTDGPDHPMKLGRRGCTDCLCLILFVIFWAGMAFIAYLGVTFGDANALVYGQDYMANRCGVGAYADAKVAVMNSSHSEKEAETLSSSEPGLQGPRVRAYS